MAVHRFVLLVNRIPADEQIAALGARHHDLLVGSDPAEGGWYVAAARSAPSLVDAFASVVRDVEAVGLVPIRVDDGDWVTLADIAERIGRSREAVRLWSVGRLGPGGFPPKLNPRRDTAFYSWAEVVPWLREKLGLEVSAVEPTLTAAGLALRLRALAPHVPRMDAIRNLLLRS